MTQTAVVTQVGATRQMIRTYAAEQGWHCTASVDPTVDVFTKDARGRKYVRVHFSVRDAVIIAATPKLTISDGKHKAERVMAWLAR